MTHLNTIRTTLVSAINRKFAVVLDFLILQDKRNIRALTLNIELISTRCQINYKIFLFYLFLSLVQINYIVSSNVRILYIYHLHHMITCFTVYGWSHLHNFVHNCYLLSLGRFPVSLPCLIILYLAIAVGYRITLYPASNILYKYQ